MISQIRALGELDAYLHRDDGPVLLVLDIDETLIRSPLPAGTDAGYQNRIIEAMGAGASREDALRVANQEWESAHEACAPELIEPNSPDLVRRWQSSSWITILGLTARRPEFSAKTLAHLGRLGLHFEPLASFPERDLGRGMRYRGGILFVGDMNRKGDCLSHFLRIMNSMPARLVAVDDRPENVDGLHRTALELGIPCFALRYQG